MTTALSRKHNKYSKNNSNNSRGEDEAEKPIKNSYAFALIFPASFAVFSPPMANNNFLAKNCSTASACLLINFYAFLQMFNPKNFDAMRTRLGAFLFACSEASQSMASETFVSTEFHSLAHRRPQKIAQKSLANTPPTWLTLIGPIKRCSLISWHQLSFGSGALALPFRPLLPLFSALSGGQMRPNWND